MALAVRFLYCDTEEKGRGRFNPYNSPLDELLKGKKTIESLESAAILEAQKINNEVSLAREEIEHFRGEHGGALITDPERLEQMKPDEVIIELNRRLERAMIEEEKRKARQEAEQAKRELEAAKKSESTAPPKAADPIKPKPKNNEPTEEYVDRMGEMNRFLETARAAFMQIKIARSELRHPENIRLAGDFAKAVNGVWEKMEKGGVS